MIPSMDYPAPNNESQAPAPAMDELEERIRRNHTSLPDWDWMAHLIGIIDKLRGEVKPSAGAVEAAFREGHEAGFERKGVEGAWETSEAIKAVTGPLVPAPLDPIHGLAERLANGIAHMDSCAVCAESTMRDCAYGGQEAAKALTEYNATIPEINCHGIPEDRPIPPPEQIKGKV